MGLFFGGNSVNMTSILKIMNISASEYVYEEDGNLISFPRQPLKAEDNFVYTYYPSIWHEGYDNSAATKYLEDTNEFAIYYYFSDVANLFDGSDDTTCGIGESYRALYFKFAKETKVSQIKLRVTGDTYYPTSGSIHGTNLQAMATTCEESNKIVSFNIPAGIKMPTDMVIDVNQSFKYFGVLSGGTVYACEIIADGRVYTMTLKSANMTPSIKVYPKDYMQITTQDWYNGSDIIPSQTLLLKPFEDGGHLVNYEDNGSAVNLGLYLVQPTGEVITKSFIQPVLSANGTMGGDAFAVEMDSVVDSNRQVWKAFDGNTVMNDASYDQAHTSSGQPHWIKFYNPEPLNISKLTIYNGASNVLPLDWEFQYSDTNTDEDWHTLTSGTNTELTQNGVWEINIENSGEHQYYRFRTTSGSGSDSSYLGITEIQITGSTKVQYDEPMYVLSPDDSFTLKGFGDKTLVTQMNIPAHIYYNGSDWVMGE